MLAVRTFLTVLSHRYIKNKKTFNVSPKKFPSEDFFPDFFGPDPPNLYISPHF